MHGSTSTPPIWPEDGQHIKSFQGCEYGSEGGESALKEHGGYRTGNWGPLMLEVKSWVLVDMAASVALSLFTAILSTFTCRFR